MGGIGLGSTNLNRTPHTHVRTYTDIRNTQYATHTTAQIYMHREQKYTHIHMHTICTQFAHTQHREQNTEYNNMQHIEQDTEQDTEQRTEQRTEHSTDDLHKYSFDYYDKHNISKNYIIQLYKKLIHFGHLINKVSKITITLIY